MQCLYDIYFIFDANSKSIAIMYKLIYFVAFALFGMLSYAQNKLTLIPKPMQVTAKKDSFTLPQNILLKAPQHSELETPIKFLKEKLSQATGYKVTPANGDATVSLILNKNPEQTIGGEGYKLSVSSSGIKISANKPAGLFYGMQTLLQLLPPEIENTSEIKNITWKLPQVEITDRPEYPWRGMMFDVSRHFFTVAEVKHILDEMSRYKLNRFHFHLVDDEGWRLEIKSLPKLTSVGAWRVPAIGHFGTFPQAPTDAAKTYGGFYTQSQIKELIQYAKERFIEIMPEIDMPGHSMALLAAYPEMSCTPNLKVSPRIGEPIADWTTHTLLVDNTICPANEEVYKKIDMIVKEVSQLFPFEYIHMGGDEAFYTFWEKSTAVKELMQKENLKTMRAVQGYFEKRVEKIVNVHGKKMMGWDEIFEAGVEPSTAIMGWRGNGDVGIKASNAGHKVVMSPSKHTYIDLQQGDPAIEPPVYDAVRLKDAYAFDPAPAGANKANILGGQANLWTEQISMPRHAEYMMWPRTLAVAENVWSSQKDKNWSDFVHRTEAHMRRMDYAKINYSPAMYDPIVQVQKQKDNEILITLTSEIDGLEIHYSFDNSLPDHFYPIYSKPLSFPFGSDRLKVITYKKGETKPAGRLLVLTKEDLKKRAR